MDADLGLGRHAGGSGGEGHPLATAVAGELRHEQPAVFEQVRVVAALDVAPLAHEAVEELAPLVVAHVDDHPAVRGEDHLRVLMLEAAEGGALLRGGCGVEGVDLDDVARAVGLVGVPGDVEALVRRGPRIAPVPRADAVALERGADLDVGIARREVAVEVLLAREIGAPRSASVAAVVPGAEARRAGRIGGGLQEIVPAGRSRDLHRRVRGDAAVEGRVLDDGPHAVPLLDLDHRDPVAGLALAHVVRVSRCAGARTPVDDAEVHVFVVDREDVPPPAAEQRHAVDVVAEGELLALPGAACLLVELGGTGPHRIAPPGDDLPAIAGRNGDCVEGVGGDGLEAEPIGGGGCGSGREGLERPGAHDERGGPEGGASAQEPASRDDLSGQLAELRLERPRVVDFIEFVEGDVVCVIGPGAWHEPVSTLDFTASARLDGIWTP